MVNKKYLLLAGEDAVTSHMAAKRISQDVLLRYYFNLQIDELHLQEINSLKNNNAFFRQRLDELDYFISENRIKSYTAYSEFIDGCTQSIVPSVQETAQPYKEENPQIISESVRRKKKLQSRKRSSTSKKVNQNKPIRRGKHTRIILATA